MTFATYSTGYKGQAYDLVSAFDARTASQMPVPAETAKNYEIGMKSTLFDRRLYLNVTAFNADFYGFQTTITATLPDGTFLTALNSVGHLRTRGLEVDALARITSRLRLNAAGAYTDATVIEFPNGPCYNNQALSAGGCHLDNTNSRVQDLAGERLNNTPEWEIQHRRPVRRAVASPALRRLRGLRLPLAEPGQFRAEPGSSSGPEGLRGLRSQRRDQRPRRQVQAQRLRQQPLRQALRLLKTWCDGFLAYQVRGLRGEGVNGGLLCPACGIVHGRNADAVYPLLRMARTSGDARYVRGRRRGAGLGRAQCQPRQTAAGSTTSS
jgi:hypothetical protein